MLRHTFFVLLLIVSAALAITPRASFSAEKPVLEAMRELEQTDTAEVRRRADAGEPNAQLEMAVRYATGRDVEKDDQKALDIIKPLAEKNAQAMYLMGAAHANGIGMPKNDAEAMRWFERASRKGNPNAQYGIATMLQAGQNGGAGDWKKALPWYRKAAEQGHGNAAFMLGYAYDKGYGVKIDGEQAATWYRRANADHFHAQAQWNLSLLIRDKRITPRSGDPAEPSVEVNAK